MPSLYDISITVLQKVLITLSSILKKGEQYAHENNISESDLLASRIYEDMLPLTNQVLIIQMATSRALEKLTGTGLPAPGANLGLQQLHTLIEDTLQALKKVDEKVVNEKEGQEVVFQVGPKFTKRASAEEYIQGYTIPYAYFHLNIAYAILRQRGVKLGKLDYIKEFALVLEDAQ